MRLYGLATGGEGGGDAAEILDQFYNVLALRTLPRRTIRVLCIIFGFVAGHIARERIRIRLGIVRGRGAPISVVVGRSRHLGQDRWRGAEVAREDRSIYARNKK
jgi:hypothetical protein